MGRSRGLWSTLAAIASSVAAMEVGSRVGLPGVNSERLQQFFESTNTTLLTLYNALAGGGTSRGALLALGALPYVQARLYLWLAQAASPRIRGAMLSNRRRRWTTRLLTVGVGAVQSFGFAQFLNGLPGAVAEPGFAFVARTVLLCTAGAAAVGWMADTLLDATSRGDAEESDMTMPSELPASDGHPIDQPHAPRELPAPSPVFTTPATEAVRVEKR